jgi:hypothetical protein
MTWGPPRFAHDSSIAAQFDRALSESFGIALHPNENLSWSTDSNGVGHPVEGVNPKLRPVVPGEWCVNVTAGIRITDMQELTIEPQRLLIRTNPGLFAATAGYWEPDEARGSRPALRPRGDATPPRHSPQRF